MGECMITNSKPAGIPMRSVLQVIFSKLHSRVFLLKQQFDSGRCCSGRDQSREKVRFLNNGPTANQSCCRHFSKCHSSAEAAEMARGVKQAHYFKCFLLLLFLENVSTRIMLI